VFFWTEDDCYHQACDSPENIDYEHMASILRMSTDLTVTLATEPDLATARDEFLTRLRGRAESRRGEASRLARQKLLETAMDRRRGYPRPSGDMGDRQPPSAPRVTTCSTVGVRQSSSITPPLKPLSSVHL